MAQTAAAVQAQLGANPMNATILRNNEVNGIDATTQSWYVDGRADAPGRERWCVTTSSQTAAQQAADILVQLRT